MKNMYSRITAVMLSMTFLAASVTTVQADFVATETVVADAQLSYQKDDLLATLQSEQVREKLVSMGVDPTQVEDRVAAMTIDEVAQINAHMDDMAAGGDALGIILTLFIVFIITDAICATDIFPFVNCINTST